MNAWRLLGTSLLAALLVACALAPQNVDQAASPVARMRERTQSMIVVAVDNPPESVAVRAGSTPRGYDVAPRYAAGASARAALAAVTGQYGLHEVTAWPILPLRLHCAVLVIPDAAERENLLSALQHDPRLRLAQPLQTFATLASNYNDPYFGLQRGFVQIGAGEAQRWSRGENVRVALIDTGLDSAHPDLRGRVAMQRNFVDEDAPAFNHDRHGTEVAGVIAADANNRVGIVGVAPEVQILALKACWPLQAAGEAGQCNSFTLAQALTIAIESGAQLINLSLGGPADPLLAQLVEYALKRGIVVVGAVPPDGRLDGFPVGVPGVIAVDVAGGAVSDARVLHAPGREILTLTPGGHYDFASGSSLAAAHVSGAVALLLARNPKLDGAEVYELLQRSHLQADSINACAALASLRAGDDCGPAPAVAGAGPH